MHYLDPAGIVAPAPPPEEGRTDTLPPLLLRYQEYFASGGGKGFVEWVTQDADLDARCAQTLPLLPTSLYRRGRGRSRTPIADVLSSDRYDERDRARVREVVEALHALDSCVDQEVTACRAIPPAACRRLDFSDGGESSHSHAPPREDSPTVVAMDETEPPPVGLESLAARIAAVLDAPEFGITIPYRAYASLTEDDFYSGDAFAPALACELALISAAYDIPLADATPVIVRARSSDAPHTRKHREWEGRHVYELALARAIAWCEHTKHAISPRIVAQHIAALRPPLAQAATAHVLRMIPQNDLRVIAWVSAASRYGGLRVSWTDVDVSPARKTFDPPYMTPATLSEGRRLMPQFRNDLGTSMTDRESATFVCLLAYALVMCAEFDPKSLATARREAGYAISHADITEYANIWHVMAMFAEERPEIVDSYVVPSTANYAIDFLDARNAAGSGHRGPQWYTFVRVTATIEKMVADSPNALFQPHYMDMFVTRDAVQCPHTISGVLPSIMVATVDDFLRMARHQYAIMGVRGMENLRTMSTIGLFLAAVRNALRDVPLGYKHSVKNLVDETIAVLSCVRAVNVDNSSLNMAQFIIAVADRVHGSNLTHVFMALWDLWLPRFAEAALVVAARSAVADPAFDARAQVTAVEPGAPLDVFLHHRT